MKKINCKLSLLAIFAMAVSFTYAFDCVRVFREPRYTRGDTNVRKIQPIDEASWIWNNNSTAKFQKFRCKFTASENSKPLTIDVSADERFYLTLDGKFIARGPNRGTVENWQYQTYTIDKLEPGSHTLEAVVWRIEWDGPLAQLSYRGGFVLKADGEYNKALTTGTANWEVGEIKNIRSIGVANGVWGTGAQFEITGRGPYDGDPEKYVKASVVRGGAGANYKEHFGGRTIGWMLYPTQLPDQTEYHVTPGKIRAVTTLAKWRDDYYLFTEADTKNDWVAKFNDLLQKGVAITIPAKTKLQLAWDLDRYICAYPLLAMNGGEKSRVAIGWTESARNGSNDRKANRDEIIGKKLQGYGDDFISDGKAGEFSAPWFRCGRWCRVNIETKDEPLTITKLSLIESRYPAEMESTFVSPQDQSLQDIRRICTRAMQMCYHEMLFDCPFYEQQMYPGDTRVQLNVISALSRDDRMIRRAIEIYDLATRDDGMCPMNYPTRGLQESLSYTLCYLCMYGDYVMNHDNREWLKARVPGMRKTMAGVEYYENENGLLLNPPGWNFMDWTIGWNRGTVPGTYNGELICELNLFWLLSMQSVAKVERVLGYEGQAKYWEEKAAKLKSTLVATFWDEGRGLFAHNPKGKVFSEHAQCLAILADAVPAGKEKDHFNHLITDSDLGRCTVYFTYYLFDAYFKMGRADLFLNRLDLWRGYVKLGVTTLLEEPEFEKHESRSDCHAWGAHPIWFMQTGLAGIKSAAPFFAKVLVAPQPGNLRKIEATHPHPKGWIKVKLEFNNGVATGSVETPIAGTFEFGSQKLELHAGVNQINAK